MGETIRLTAGDGHQLDAYLAEAQGAARGRLVVIQEIFGVNGHIRDVCDRFATQGYTALAPAMFDRVEKGVELDYDADGIAAGREIRAKISWQQTGADVAAARDHLAVAGPVGIVGYCWGGSVAWYGAQEGGFAAAIGYYGGQIAGLLDRAPQCPVLLHFGAEDGAIPLSDVETVGAAFPDVPIHVYEGAGHGFNCDRRASYHPEAAALALERTMAFLAQNVG